jgi:hypothetical protein
MTCTAVVSNPVGHVRDEPDEISLKDQFAVMSPVSSATQPVAAYAISAAKITLRIRASSGFFNVSRLESETPAAGREASVTENGS